MTEGIFKILAVLLVAACLCVVLKPKAGEYAFVVMLGAGIIVLAFVFSAVSQPIKEISQKLQDSGIETEYFKIALKAIGIAYVTDFIADSCRDAGQSSIASKAELAGKAAIFLLTVPLLMSVLETALGFIK